MYKLLKSKRGEEQGDDTPKFLNWYIMGPLLFIILAAIMYIIWVKILRTWLMPT